MSERFPSSTATLPDEYAIWKNSMPSQESQPNWNTDPVGNPYQWNLPETATPTNPYMAYEPKAKETTDYNWGTAPSYFNVPNSAAPNILPYADNYSRLADLKERGGDMLRRVVKLGGSAVSKTVEIAKNLVPRRDKQIGIDYSIPTYQSNFFPAENTWSAPPQPTQPTYEQSWGSHTQPAAPAYETGWNTPTTESYSPAPESHVGGSRLRSMFNKVGNIAQSSGSELSTQFNRLPPEAQTMALGISRGALNGVLEDYMKVKKNGKRRVKVTSLARAAANPTGAVHRAVKHGIQGGRQGGIDSFGQVRSQNSNIDTAASFATSARDIARRFGR